MKKRVLFIGTIIWFLIAAALLVVFVLALTGNLNLSWLSNGGVSMIFNLNLELVKEESFQTAGLEEISITTSYHNIELTLADGDAITVRQYDVDGGNLFTSAESGDKLSVEIESRMVIFGISFSSPRLEIQIPERYFSKVTLKTSSGAINCSPDEAPGWGSASISSNSGNIRLDSGIHCAALSLSSVSGSINLGDTASGSVSVNSHSGTQRLGNIQSEGRVSLASTSGSITAGTVSGSALSVQANSGTLRLSDIAATEEVSLKSTSGSINCEDIASGNVRIESNSGTLRGGDIKADGQVSVSSTSGSHHFGSVKGESFNISANSGTLVYDGLSGKGSMETSSGSITCESLDITGNSSIHSNSGTQRLTLAKDQSFEITISTSSGSIRANDIQLYYSDQNGKNATGTVGSGANGTLDLRTTSGSINIG